MTETAAEEKARLSREIRDELQEHGQEVVAQVVAEEVWRSLDDFRCWCDQKGWFTKVNPNGDVAILMRARWREEMTATEKISNDDLALLAGVMGWVQVANDWSKGLEDLLPSENHFTVRTHDKFQDAVCRFVDGNLNKFDPTRDTPEGLWQAVKLRDTWCDRHPEDAWFQGQRDDGLYRVVLMVPRMGPPLEYIGEADTEPLAITRAVLAAVKGAAMMADWFPIHPTSRGKYGQSNPYGVPNAVPWSLVAPFGERAKLNHDQTLTRLAERGGLDLLELYRLLNDRDLRHPWETDEECAAFVLAAAKAETHGIREEDDLPAFAATNSTKKYIRRVRGRGD